MRRFTILPVLLILLLVLATGCATSYATPTMSVMTTPTAGPTGGTTLTPAQTGDQVTIQNFAFDPIVLTVTVGTTVTWTNKDSAGHRPTFADFASGTLATGDTFQHTFDTAGTFDYHCSIHPSMTGKIIVK